jgi:molybdate/tungstate transport system permease protein
VFLLLWLFGSLLLAFVLIPLLVLAGAPSLSGLVDAARMPDVRNSILLSLEAAFLSAILTALFGVPLAYVLARSHFVGQGIISAIVDLPLAVPHTVAGIALLMVFGRHGILGEPLQALVGLKFWGTLAGVVAAMMFVSAPYTVNAARVGFEGVDLQLEKIARTLGLGPWRTFIKITLPLARRGIFTGMMLTFARSISEFGAVVILVYYPKTAPVEIYELFLRFNLQQAVAAAVLLLAVSLGLFVLFRFIARTAVRENR